MIRGTLWVVVAVLLSACDVQSNAVQCEQGRICPEGTVCDETHDLCVSQEQVDQCSGKDDRADCTFAGTDGACQQGVCLGIGCGNGRLDRIADEQCDDGNNADGDGCSGNCKSDERCGNGLLDVARGEQCDDGGNLDHDGCSSSCETETMAWWLNKAPGPLSQARAVLDVVRGKVVVVAGRVPGTPSPGFDHATNAVSEYGDGVWHTFIPTAFAPAPQPVALATSSDPVPPFALAYDVGRRLTVMAGGKIGNSVREVWGWDGRGWTRLPDLPVALDGLAMAYDAKRKRLVVFGGRTSVAGNTTVHDDTYELAADAEAWTTVTTAAKPAARFNTTLAYDPKRGVLVLAGGNPVSDDLWEYDGTTWVQKIATGAGIVPSRDGPSMAFDRASGQLAYLDDGNFNGADMYFWDGTSFSKFTGAMPMALPTGGAAQSAVRYAPTFVEDGRGRLMIYGGQTQFGTNPSNLLTNRLQWFYENGQWDEGPTRASPAVLGCFASVGDRGTVVRYGGNPSLGSTPALAETWEASWRGWTKFDTGNPPGLEFCGLAYDTARDQLVLFGGETNNGTTQTPTNETWLRSGTTWSKQTPTVTWPSARIGHGFAYDAARNETVMFGGRAAAPSSSTRFGDTWVWNGTAWVQRTPATSPTARSSVSMAYDPVGRVVVLFGGSPSQNVVDNQTWVWDGTTWTDLTPTLAELPTEGEFAAFNWSPARQALVLVNISFLAGIIDVWEWKTTSVSPYAGRWQRVNTASQPGVRVFSSGYSSVDGSGITLAYGFNNVVLDELWELRSDARGSDTCAGPMDGDGDGLTACADPDCWRVCTPDCPPGTSCPADGARCGDGTCSAIETCRTCPADCTTCTDTSCGDFVCDPGESCPGDCP